MSEAAKGLLTLGIILLIIGLYLSWWAFMANPWRVQAKVGCAAPLLQGSFGNEVSQFRPVIRFIP